MKKHLTKLTAMTMAAAMIAATPAMAEVSTSGTGIETADDDADVSNGSSSEDQDSSEDDNTSSGIEASGDEVHETGDVNTSGTSSPGISADDNSTVTVDGNVTGGVNGIEATDSTVSVGGNVTAENGSGVTADNSTVSVKGDVNSTESGVVADSSTVDVGGKLNSNSTGIIANDSTVTVKGDVTSRDAGIVADNGNIEVGGNVTAGNESVGIDASNSSNIIVNGDVIGGDGAYADGSNVTIKGSVTAKDGIGVCITGTDKTTMVVDGDVTAKDAAIDVADSENADSELVIAGKVSGENGATVKVSIDDTTGKVNTLPEIVVGEITDFDKISVKDYYTDKEVPADVKKEVLDNIKYIVSTNDTSMNGKGTISISKVNGAALDKDGLGLFDVAKAFETITVHIDVQSGYEVSEVRAGKASLTRNADGTYSVTVPAGGGVNIEALVRAIENGTYVSSDSDGSDFTVYANKATSVWNFDGINWTYTKPDGSKATNEWLQLEYGGQTNWYYFDADSNMKTGWFQDISANLYYLNPVSDGFKGAMKKGDVEINGNKYFFNDGTVVELPEGALVNQ